MKYVVIVQGKYLQMLVAYSIFKEDSDQVTDHFEQHIWWKSVLNCSKWSVTWSLTSQVFKAGMEVKALKPVAPVKPTQWQSKPELRLSDLESTQSQQFFVRHRPQELIRGLSSLCRSSLSRSLR